MNWKSLYRLALHPLVASLRGNDDAGCSVATSAQANDHRVEDDNSQSRDHDCADGDIASILHSDSSLLDDHGYGSFRRDLRPQDDDDAENSGQNHILDRFTTTSQSTTRRQVNHDGRLSDEELARILQLEEAYELSREIDSHMSRYTSTGSSSTSLSRLLHPLHNERVAFDEAFALRVQDQEISDVIRRQHMLHLAGDSDDDDDDDAYSDDDGIDPDNMTYEQLLELEEHIGTVNCGATKADIEVCPVHTFMGTNGNKNSPLCLVCQEDYEIGNLLRTLPCHHAYHKDCIDKWLSQKPTCPVCHRSVKKEP
jgi:hypothetical protein